ncbi:hypothetical protein SAMN05421748_11441 [Paractinoplanes atraurantiacus]|uniref:Uncharacterized protein n=1 Tax=Paractinoplanes atraurantiacus TaxID=1036182 RepID=A0A285IZN8_9ACTN|nr:hypothetical protein SAMN05421748_11441 [Actinoplanes atraurantiacus]
MLETLVHVGVLAVGFGWVMRRRRWLGRVAWPAAGGLALLAVAALGDVAWLLFTLGLVEGRVSSAWTLTYVRWNSTIGTATGMATVGGMLALAGSVFLRRTA